MIAILPLAVPSILIVVRALQKRERFLQYPTCLAALFIAFILPQAIAVERSTLSQVCDTHYVWTYMGLALLACTLGFRLGRVAASRKSLKVSNTPRPALSRRTLTLGSLALMALGSLAAFRVNAISSSTELGNQWTGVATMWYALLQATFFALTLSSLSYLRNRNPLNLYIVTYCSVSVLSMVAANAKRHMLAELAIITIGSYFFVTGVAPRRRSVVAACLLGTVVLHQVGTIRAYIASGKGNAFEAVLDGVPFDGFDYWEQTRLREVALATIDVDTARRNQSLEGTSEFVNALVHQYVPAFLVGANTKARLMRETNMAVKTDAALSSYTTPGTTRMGFSDSYRALGPIGLIIFVAIGALLGFLYDLAVRGSISAQFYYLILLNDGLIAITDSTARFFAGLLFILGLTAPVFILAGRMHRRPLRQKQTRSRIVAAARTSALSEP